MQTYVGLKKVYEIHECKRRGRRRPKDNVVDLPSKWTIKGETHAKGAEIRFKSLDRARNYLRNKESKRTR